MLWLFQESGKELEEEDKDCSDIPFIYSIIYGTNVIMMPCSERNFYRRNLKFKAFCTKKRKFVTSKIFTFMVLMMKMSSTVKLDLNYFIKLKFFHIIKFINSLCTIQHYHYQLINALYNTTTAQIP